MRQNLILVLLSLAACSEHTILTSEERQVYKDMANRLPPAEAYALHEKVFSLRQPPYEFLAPIIVKKDNRVMRIALEKASHGTATQVLASIPVLSSGVEAGLRCEPQDLKSIEHNITTQFGRAAHSVQQRIKLACGIKLELR